MFKRYISPIFCSKKILAYKVRERSFMIFDRDKPFSADFIFKDSFSSFDRRSDIYFRISENELQINSVKILNVRLHSREDAEKLFENMNSSAKDAECISCGKKSNCLRSE